MACSCAWFTCGNSSSFFCCQLHQQRFNASYTCCIQQPYEQLTCQAVTMTRASREVSSSMTDTTARP